MSKVLAEKYSDIEAVKNKFLKKVAHLSYEQFNKIPSKGGWSIGQTLYHCAFVESGVILVINKNLSENKTTLKSDLVSKLRSLLLVGFLKSPLKIKAPKVASKVPDTISVEDIKKYFDKNAVDFKKLLNELPVELEDKFIFKHPLAGLFNIKQTIGFTTEHYLHHEQQLDALM